ncbi:MAG: helix-turn-helix domain-containing protein [Deltaproteobacteria bacterium]|nr:helix-turn-helix domain-containing protein [Deltaproteobacteria bacterium]MBW2069480.1 helix-turn-helix domain-containing protein [Deltaproteobacteria bacterium]
MLIARDEVEKFFPGLKPKTLANLAWQGRGPRYYRQGRRVFYRVEDIERWLTQQPILTADSSIDYPEDVNR